MPPGEPDSDKVTASPESPAVTPPAHEPAPRPAEAQASATAPTGVGANQNVEDRTAVPKAPPHLERWSLEADHSSTGKITAKLWQSAEAKSRWAHFRDNLKDLGPPVTGIASAVIAGLVLYYGYQFNKRQVATQEAQVKTQKTQADTAQNELQLKILSEFGKSLAELSAPDKKTRTLAAIRFVQYRHDALPALKLALGVGEDSVRNGAETVVAELFQSEAVPREQVLTTLFEYFHTNNAYLRIGILQCFIDLNRRLSPAEASEVTNLLTLELKPEADCSREEEVEALRQAAVFLGLWPSPESANLLLRIAKNRTCLRARIQAVDNLPKVAQALKPEYRKSIVDDLQRLVPDDSKDLTQQIGLAIDAILRMRIQ